MSDGVPPRRAPRARPRSEGTGARVGALCVGAVILVLALGRADGPWLCVPLTLLACLACRTPRGAAAATAAVLAAGLAASVTSVADAGALGAGRARAPAALLLVVTVASAGVLVAARERLVRERDALRGFALTDPLTRIANRRSLLARAEYEIERHRRARHSFALVMLDLDGFKMLNDRFGHPAGDDLLCDVARGLQRAMRAQDTVARFGGDEFCVLAPETDPEGTDRLADRITQAVGDVTVGLEAVRASLGVALFPLDGTGAAELLDAADRRLLEAKRRRGAGRRADRRSAA